MVFGPCGGVHGVDACEVPDVTCPFIGPSAPVDRSPLAPFTRRIALPEPTIVVDVRAPAGWPGDVERLWRETAAVLAAHGAVALLGEHVDNPRREDDSGPIAETAAIAALVGAGVPTIATVTGRDRELDEAERHMRALGRAGAAAIHCVTGDHPAALAIDRPARFGAEGVTLAARAASIGLGVSVAESPASPGRRVERVLAKQRAGAEVCILNHGGDVAELVGFVAACRAAGVTLRFVAPVPMIGDLASAEALARFPGLRLPAGVLARLVAADGPLAAGVAVAGELVGEMAAAGCFAGVNLSGGASTGDPWARLRATAAFLVAMRRVLSHPNG